MREILVGLRLDANVTGLTGGLRTGQSSIKGFVGFSKREFHELDGIIGKVQKGIAGLGVGIGVGAFLGNATKESAKTEYALRDMGNAGGISKKELDSLQISLLGTAQKTGQFRKDLVGGIATLVGAGEEFGLASKEIEDIGYAASATNADITDLAKATFALRSNLGLLPKDVKPALAALGVGGWEGAFELKDMARYLPSITAEASKLKISGVEGAASLAAGLQVARLGTGTQEEAATNMQNFLSKLTMPDTVKNFKKNFGIDWPKEYILVKFKVKTSILPCDIIRP